MADASAAGLILEGIGLFFHAKDLNVANNEGSVSHYIQCTTFGKTYVLRNVLLAANLVAILAITLWGAELVSTLGWALVALSVTLTALIGRSLFYVLVVPTTMPGAFFWRNKGFEEHAREIGLAANPAVGVAMHTH